jgi:Protein of unknown function (DUF3313)
MKLLNILILLLPIVIAGCVTTQYPTVSHDGLQLLAETNIDAAYKKTEADFSAYKRFQVTSCDVAFRRNWQRDQNQNRSLFNNVSNKDVEKIKRDLAELCRKTFVAELTEKGGYEIVEEAAEDVLIIKPAIIDLDIAAPDVGSMNRTRSYVTSAGSMRLNLELYDSVTGEILARAIDRKKAHDAGRITWSNSVSNRVEAERMFKRWSLMLREQLDGLKN